jgi:hypothetical protein
MIDSSTHARRCPAITLPGSAAMGGLVLALTVLGLPELGAAQDRSVTWTEVSRVEAPGRFGVFLQAMPGGMGERESSHGIHVMGSRIRQDDGSSSMIMDLEEGRWISIDHDSQSYMEFETQDFLGLADSFSEIAQEIEQDLQVLSDELQADRDAALEELRLAMDEASAEMDVSIESRATGERQTISGFSAERHMILAEVRIRDEVQGVDAGEEGSLVFLVDVWQTDEFPSPDALYEEWALQLAQDPEFQRLAEDLSTSFEPVTGAMGPEALAVWDPRIAGGLDRIAEVLEGLDGTAMRTVVSVAVVPEGSELDEEVLLGWEPSSMGDEIQAAVGDAARGAVQDAARGAIQGLGGRFGLGGRGGDPEPEPAEPATVRALLRVTTEIQDVQQTTSVSPDLFLPADGYSRQELPNMEELLRSK